MMLRKVLMIMFFVPFVSIFLFSPEVRAAESIYVTGEWEVEYDINDSAVSETGGTAVIKVYVTNTSVSNTIYYTSIDLCAGTASRFYRNDPIEVFICNEL